MAIRIIGHMLAAMLSIAGCFYHYAFHYAAIFRRAIISPPLLRFITLPLSRLLHITMPLDTP